MSYSEYIARGSAGPGFDFSDYDWNRSPVSRHARIEDTTQNARLAKANVLNVGTSCIEHILGKTDLPNNCPLRNGEEITDVDGCVNYKRAEIDCVNAQNALDYIEEEEN